MKAAIAFDCIRLRRLLVAGDATVTVLRLTIQLMLQYTYSYIFMYIYILTGRGPLALLDLLCMPVRLCMSAWGVLLVV